MNTNPMISVVMPVYNAENYLEEAIESILKQTYKNFEFIIIDDGSTDRSLEIAEKYKNQEERIVLISRENRGLITSLNEGIERAQGKYIARMDADDISLPQRFEKQLELMEKKDADICGSHFHIINEHGNYIDSHIVPLDFNQFLIHLSITTPFAHPSVIIKKDFLVKNKLTYGFSKYKNAEDYALWIEMWEKKAKFVNVNSFLIKYRNFTESLSKKNKKNLSKDSIELSKEFILANENQYFKYFSSVELGLKPFREQQYIALIIFVLIRRTFSLRYLQFLKKLSKQYVFLALLIFLKKRY